jgi:eukaryotic-like serine/threonine-protein kinase
MSAPTTTAELLELVFKSGVADEARLRAYVANLTATGALPDDPTPFAEALVRDGFLTPFLAEKLLQGKRKGLTIGPYAVLEQLAIGAMGTFFLCEHTRVPRVVAIKVMLPARAEDPSGLEHFLREARVLSACDHPNIVRTSDIDQHDNVHFLVTEYIDGTNLNEILTRSGPLDPVRTAHYTSQAAVGLQYLHDLGLVHRNIKPGKLKLDRRGVIKVWDLATALFVHEARKIDEGIRGTIDYISPEQSVDSAGVDLRADIYSLGCTAYHLLTGQVPFPVGSTAQKLIWHRIRAPQPIRALRPEVPEEMARVVERMMGKDPKSRYQSAAEVVAALAPWCDTPIPPPPPEEMPNHCPRTREAIERSARATSRAS